MLKKTALYQIHQQLGATFIPFAGWQMPLHYGSQIAEHQWVRTHAGVFDVSHMGIIDIAGKQATDCLRKVLANDVLKLQDGKALYTCMLNEQAGILDDLIVYRLSADNYRLIVNAATTAKDLTWIKEISSAFAVQISLRSECAILAIQGPQVWEKMPMILHQHGIKIPELKPFTAVMVKDWLMASTGYTGEKGMEIILPPDQAVLLWQNLLKNEIKPIGLGARDSLRLEAGFNLYGQDMDESVTPLESNLAWSVDWHDPDRQFIGKTKLQVQQEKGPHYQLVGILLQTKQVGRAGMRVWVQDEHETWLLGKLTSGGFAPTLSCSIGFARIPVGNFSQAFVEIRGEKVAAKIVKLPFVRQGKKVC